jgi:MFS family permease
MAQFGTAYSHRTELEGTAALAVVAMLLAAAFGLSTLITPLYLIYQQQLGFSQITLTLIYAAYAVGNVAALLFFGRVSDRAGRRLTALSGIATLIVASLVFLFADGIAWLYRAHP